MIRLWFVRLRDALLRMKSVAELRAQLAESQERLSVVMYQRDVLQAMRSPYRGTRNDLRDHILCFPRLHDVALIPSPGHVDVYAYPKTPLSDAELEAFNAHVHAGVPVPVQFVIHIVKAPL